MSTDNDQHKPIYELVYVSLIYFCIMSFDFRAFLRSECDRSKIRWPFSIGSNTWHDFEELFHGHDINIESDHTSIRRVMECPMVWNLELSSLSEILQQIVDQFDYSPRIQRHQNCLITFTQNTSISRQLNRSRDRTWQLAQTFGKQHWLSSTDKLLCVLILSFHAVNSTPSLATYHTQSESHRYQTLQINQILTKLGITNQQQPSLLCLDVTSKYELSQQQYGDLLDYDSFLFRLNQEQLPVVGGSSGFDKQTWQHRSIIFYATALISRMLTHHGIQGYDKLAYIRWLLVSYSAKNLNTTLTILESFDLSTPTLDKPTSEEETRPFSDLIKLQGNQLTSTLIHYMNDINSFLKSTTKHYSNTLLQVCHNQVTQELRFFPQCSAYEHFSASATMWHIADSVVATYKHVLADLKFHHDYALWSDLEKIYAVDKAVEFKSVYIRDQVACNLTSILRALDVDIEYDRVLIRDVVGATAGRHQVLLVCSIDTLQRIQARLIASARICQSIDHTVFVPTMADLIQCVKLIKSNEYSMHRYTSSLEFFVSCQTHKTHVGNQLETITLLFELMDYLDFDDYAEFLNSNKTKPKKQLIHYMSSMSSIMRNFTLFRYTDLQIKEQLGEAWGSLFHNNHVEKITSDQSLSPQDKQSQYRAHHRSVYEIDELEGHNDDIFIDPDARADMENTIGSILNFDDLAAGFPVLFLLTMFSHVLPHQTPLELVNKSKHEFVQTMNFATIKQTLKQHCQPTPDHAHKSKKEWVQQQDMKWICILCLIHGIQLDTPSELASVVAILATDYTSMNPNYILDLHVIAHDSLILPVSSNLGELVDPVYMSLILQQQSDESTGKYESRYSVQAQTTDPLFHNPPDPQQRNLKRTAVEISHSFNSPILQPHNKANKPNIEPTTDQLEQHQKLLEYQELSKQQHLRVRESQIHKNDDCLDNALKD